MTTDHREFVLDGRLPLYTHSHDSADTFQYGLYMAQPQSFHSGRAVSREPLGFKPPQVLMTQSLQVRSLTVGSSLGLLEPYTLRLMD